MFYLKSTDLFFYVKIYPYILDTLLANKIEKRLSKRYRQTKSLVSNLRLNKFYMERKHTF